MYYIITSLKKERVLATSSYIESYNFIMKNKDAKIRTVDYNAKLKIMDRRDFLTLFYESTLEKAKLFNLIDIMIKGRPNVIAFLNKLNLRREYQIYKRL